ncbi:hypothetical protein BH09ACT12_BH09ACT12_20410 [soil metagenome]
MSRHHRLLPGVLAATALAVAATSLVGVPSPSQADVATQTVTFQDCDLTKDYIAIGSPVSFTTPLTLDYPTPIAASSTQTAAMTLGTLAADTFPDSFPGEGSIGVTMTFEGRDFSLTDIYEERTLASFDAGAPFDLGEFESDEIIYYSGFYDFKPKSIRIDLFGDPEGDFSYSSYSLTCDQVVNPSTMLTVAVFDPAAAALIAVDRYATKQGGRIAVSGTDFAHESPDAPDADISVTVGGLPAGSYDVDETGAFAGSLRIPPFVKPGTNVVVRATSEGESATQVITVKAGKGKVSVSPGTVKSGKKLTIKASDFKAGDTLKISLSGGKGKGKTSFATKAKVGPSGTVTKAVKLKKAATGKWKVKVVGPKSFRSAGKSFKVT